MPGHLGDERVTVQNLQVMQVREAEKIILISGAVPGANGSYVIVQAGDQTSGAAHIAEHREHRKAEQDVAAKKPDHNSAIRNERESFNQSRCQGSRALTLIEDGQGSQAVHDTVVAMRAARRSGSANTKTKAEVDLSGAKPWRQKGTGRARAGYKSSPIWRGGGVVFGPKPRDYSKKFQNPCGVWPFEKR